MFDINSVLIAMSIVFILFAVLLSIASIIKFSSILIKLVILEVLTNMLMAGIALWALIHQKPVFIDICLILALIMFLGVVAYYQFLLKRGGANV